MKLSRIISTAISLALGLSLVVPAYAAESGFTDVAANAYYADAVSWAVEQKITSGTSATTFSPDETCTKAQILTFIWRANGLPEPDLEKISTADHNPFPDLSGTEYYFKAAQWAYTKGMVAGGMNFDGNTPCSRSLAVTYLWKEAGEPQPAKEASFTDIIRALHDMNAISWAVEAGITSGTSATTFSPDATCTRGQIVTFLYRAKFSSTAGSQPQSSRPSYYDPQAQEQTPAPAPDDPYAGMTPEERGRAAREQAMAQWKAEGFEGLATQWTDEELEEIARRLNGGTSSGDYQADKKLSSMEKAFNEALKILSPDTISPIQQRLLDAKTPEEREAIVKEMMDYLNTETAQTRNQ